MEICLSETDKLLKNFIQNIGDLIMCTECRAFTENPVKAGCDHLFCRSCLESKFQNFDTQESFTSCPKCKIALQKKDMANLTPQTAQFNDILQRCVLKFCEESDSDLGNIMGNSQKVVRTYSRKKIPDTVRVSPDLRAKEKVEEWLSKNSDPAPLNAATQETASTESFKCSSNAQTRSLVSKESYDIVPAPSPPPVDEVTPRRGRGRGRPRGHRKSALQISSGDRSDARRNKTAENTPDSNKNDSPSGRASVSPTFELARQRALTSTPVVNSTPLAVPRRRGARRPASALSERSLEAVPRLEPQPGTSKDKESDDEPVVMEVDLFEPSSPETRKDEETTEKQNSTRISPPAVETQVKAQTPSSSSTESTKSRANSVSSLRFIRIPSIVNQVSLPQSSESPSATLNDANPVRVSPVTITQIEAARTSSEPSGISSEPARTSSELAGTNSEPADTRANTAPIEDNEITAQEVEVIHEQFQSRRQKIVDYSESSDAASSRQKTVAEPAVTQPRHSFINFLHRGRLAPKKTVVIRERQPIPFVKKGKFQVDGKTVEVHQCPEAPEIPSKIHSTVGTQTVVESRGISVQTDEKRVSTAEIQTETPAISNAQVQTDVPETVEIEVQTEQELLNSFVGEISVVVPINRRINSRDSSPDVFNEHSKRLRKLSSSSDETEESEPKRKRATFDLEGPTPEFQAPAPPVSPLAPPVAPPAPPVAPPAPPVAPPAPPVPSAEESAAKTVIMESDQESDSLDILAPTPPRAPPPPKRVFTCSSLQRTQVKLVQEWAKKIGAEVLPTYTPAVTHVIVVVDSDNCAQRTLKFLYGVAAGKWIVSIDWVHSSMRENCVVDEELFEALDMEGESGPSRSRTRSKTSKLFHAFEFCCQEPFTDVTVAQLRELLGTCGALTAATPAQLKKNRRHSLIVVQLDETNEAEVQRRAASWFDKYQILSVSREWVLDCLAAYKLTPIRSHLVGKHSESFLRMLRFDEQLIG